MIGSFPAASLGLMVFLAASGPVHGQAPAQANDTSLTGWVALTASVDSFLVLIDDDPESIRLHASGDPLELSAGRRKMRVASRYDVDIVSYREVIPDSVARNHFHIRRLLRLKPSEYLQGSSYPRFYWNANLAVATDPDATVYMDGDPLGSGLVFLAMPAGRQEIEIVDGRGRSRSLVAEIDDFRLEFVEHYSRPARGRARVLALIPGASQWYQGRPVTGLLFAGGAAAGVLGTVAAQNAFQDRRDVYRHVQAEYRMASDETSALEFGDEMESAYRRAASAQRMRNVLAGVTASIVVANFVESLIPPRQGYRSRYDLRADLLPFFQRPGVSLGVTRNF